MISTVKKLIILILVFSAMFSEILMAAPFDKTGIIDLKNEGTTMGSCVAVGSRLSLATNKIYLQIMQRPTKGEDERWKKLQDAEKINKFGQNGSFWSGRLSDNFREYIPPSQWDHFFSGWRSASQRFDQAVQQDPWKGVNAWNYCGEVYRFLK